MKAKAFLSSILLLLFLAVPTWPQYNPSQDVLEKALRSIEYPPHSGFEVFSSTGVDTSQTELAYTYVGISFNVKGDSVDIWAIAQCGNDTVLARADSIRVQEASKVVWMTAIPISKRVRFIFQAASSDNGSTTTLDDVTLNRQW